MPQPSYTYASARLSALSKRILDSQTVRRMSDGTLADTLRTLQDMRYGGSADINENNVEQMITSELRDTMKEVRAISPDPGLTDLFLMQADVQNLKMLLKARLLGTAPSTFTDGGLYTKDQLSAMVKEQDYRDLPAELANCMQMLEKQFLTSVDPQIISVSLDCAYLSMALDRSRKDDVLNQYFRSLADFDNILTYLRVRAMGGSKELLDDLLLPEGGIKKETLTESLDLSYEYLNRLLSSSVCRDPLLGGLNAMQRTGNIGQVEKARDNYLLSLLSSHKYDTNSIYPVIGYYLAKERESRVIRLIITAKRMMLPDSVIAERLVAMYGDR